MDKSAAALDLGQVNRYGLIFDRRGQRSHDEEIAMSIRILTGVAAAIAFCSFAAHAQHTDRSATNYDTPVGELTVRSGQPGPRAYAPPPPFAQLSGGKGYISEADAQAYDLLANDFIHADDNRDGRISQAEYARWASTPR